MVPRVPRQVLGLVGATTAGAFLLLVVLANVSRGGRPAVLLPSVGLNPGGEMKGTPFMPESIPWKFPHPFAQASGHPSLSSVELMPPDSMSWYPDQPASNSTNSTEDVQEGEQGEEVAEDEEAGSEESAAEAAPHTSMLSQSPAVSPLKTNHRVVPDPAEWLKNKMIKSVTGGKAEGRIPDPVEWLGHKVLGTSNFARKQHAAHRMRNLQKAIHSAKGTAQLSQVRGGQLTKFAMEGGFSSPNGASVSDATARANVLGCKGVHYITSSTGMLTAHPCKSQQQEFAALKGARFTDRDDMGTTVQGAAPDYSGREFKHAYFGLNAASSMDDDFLSKSAKASRSSAGHLFGNKADQADNAFLSSTMAARKQHANKAGNSPYTKWKTW